MAEALVSFMRSKFKDIRVIVPQAAMSAATMLACSANLIVMGKHSSLGSIEPLVTLSTAFGHKPTPVGAVIREFRMAEDDSRNKPGALTAWRPILSQYAPGLLADCMRKQNLAKVLTKEWLESYMFHNDDSGADKAAYVTNHLLTSGNFLGHGRRLSIKKAKEMGLKVEDLEEDQTLQDLVLSVFHSTMLSFQYGNVEKIIECHTGRGFYTVQSEQLARHRTGRRHAARARYACAT